MELRLEITPVQPCYLELARPTIEEGLAALYRRGVVRAIVVPLQLTAGRHVRYDIPSEVGQSLAKLSKMLVCFTKHLGDHPTLVEMADSRLDEAMADHPTNVRSTEHLLVARGSRDPLVRGEVFCWAASRRYRETGADFKPCFLAMTQPTFEEGLQSAVSKAPDRIVVQPHLLYPGRLLRQGYERVAEMADQTPHIEWVSTRALAPDPRLVECALDLASQAIDRKFRRDLDQPPIDEADPTCSTTA